MEVGQRVYAKDHYINKEPNEYEVMKVGRLYFYIAINRTSRLYKCDIKSLGCIDNHSIKIYLSIQEYLDEQEFNSTLRYVERKIGCPHTSNITLDTLRQIKRIIDGGEEVECQS